MLAVPLRTESAPVARVIGDGAVLDFPDPRVEQRRDDDAQMRITGRHLVLDVDSHRFAADLKLRGELQQTVTVNLTQ